MHIKNNFYFGGPLLWLHLYETAFLLGFKIHSDCEEHIFYTIAKAESTDKITRFHFNKCLEDTLYSPQEEATAQPVIYSNFLSC